MRPDRGPGAMREAIKVTMLAERHVTLPSSAVPTSPPDDLDIAEWPIAGAGTGCNAFLADLGIEDALIAFKPSVDEPRSLFVVGMHGVRRQAAGLYHLVRVADHMWEQSADAALRIVTLPVVPGDGGLNERDSERPVLFGRLPWPLEGFGQAIVARQITVAGRLDLILLHRQGRERLHSDRPALMKPALPLFLDAILAFCLARRQEQHSALLRAMFDHMTAPTLLVDEQARPLIVNGAAAALLGRRDILFRSTDGLIAARSPRENRALRAIVRRVATSQGQDDDGEMSAVRLTDRAGRWLIAIAVPARLGRDDHGVRPAVMIVIHQPVAAGAPACILSALGLLPSEQRFLDHFLRATTLAEAAEQCGLSHETARTYLKRVRAKLGAHRQMDLARLIYGLIPPLGADTTPSMEGN